MLPGAVAGPLAAAQSNGASSTAAKQEVRCDAVDQQTRCAHAWRDHDPRSGDRSLDSRTRRRRGPGSTRSSRRHGSRSIGRPSHRRSYGARPRRSRSASASSPVTGEPSWARSSTRHRRPSNSSSPPSARRTPTAGRRCPRADCGSSPSAAASNAERLRPRAQPPRGAPRRNLDPPPRRVPGSAWRMTSSATFRAEWMPVN